jgi:adenylate cyclase
MAEEGFKRKLTTILSADVVGYSRLMEDNEEATIQTLNTYRNSMSTLIEQHSGRVVDMTGDNLMAEFSSVVDAVKCAVEAQKEIGERNADLPENRRMLFRIGVNLGDIIEEGDRIYGDGVNIAARLEGLAEGGGICISGTAYDQLKNKLELGYEYLGEHNVKNIATPVRVYKALMEPEAVGKIIGEKRKTKRWMAVAAAVIILIGLAGWYLYIKQSKRIEPASVEKMAYPLPDKPSIAVLPFDNLSGDSEQEYFSDGITEQIITSLSKIPNIEELAVRYVLEGSVQRSNDRVRITVQLIDATTGRHLWAENYDREVKDIFALQDEISMKIMAALQIKLTVGAQADLKYDETENLEAYEKFLNARYHIFRRTKEDVRIGQQFAQEAIDIDPNYAAAHQMMGLLYLDEVWFGMTKSPAKSIEKAEQVAQKAISLRGYQAPDYVLLSSINLLKKDYDKAIEYGEKAVELGPNNPDALFFHGMALRYAGQYKEAISKFEKAIRLNPIKPLNYLNNLGWSYLLAKEYESAIAVFNEAIQRNPDYLFAYMGLSATYNLSGNKEKSHWAAENVLRVNPKFSLAAYEKRSPIKIAEDKERIINAMRNAGLK